MQCNKFHIFTTLLSVLFMLCLGGCSGGMGSSTYTPSILGGQSEREKEETPIVSVLKEVDTKEQTITVFAVDADSDMTLHYTGATYVYDRYDKDTVIGSVKIGEVIDVYYDTANNKATKICVNKDAWEQQQVGNITIDQTERIMELYKSKYRYSDDIVVADQEELVDLIDINSQDELTVKGMDKQVFSICITKGHGYIRPSNYKDFVGGMIEIGYNILLPVTKNMLIPVQEGVYTVRMRNGDLVGEKTVKVIRNKEITMDMSDFKAERIDEGYVTFQIRPAGADLYINGTQVFYDEPVKLNYGKHKIVVRMTGYNDYNGTLDLQDRDPTITINLVDRVAEVAEEEKGNPGTTPTPLPGSTAEPTATSPPAQEPSAATPSTGTPAGSTNVTEGENASLAATSKVIDSEHRITVTAPAGVEVYLNGTYKGLTPCSFTKEIGSHTISLSASGYQTKSYSVEVLNDSKDVSYSFADLIKDN